MQRKINLEYKRLLELLSMESLSIFSIVAQQFIFMYVHVYVCSDMLNRHHYKTNI